MASGETEGSAVSKRIVFPANFIGGPRNMRKKICGCYGIGSKVWKTRYFFNRNM